MDRCSRIRELYTKLKSAYGPQESWWPGESATEIALGAILTQNTNWQNAYRALLNLRRAKLSHDLKKLANTPEDTLAELIKPAGFYRQKARYLLEFARKVTTEAGDLEKVRNIPNPRGFLLGIRGIGHETADSILLYALNLPYFVIDAYTRRILQRTGILPDADKRKYEELRELFEGCLPKRTSLYQEFHALLVEHAKAVCKKVKPSCDKCPIRDICAWQSQE